MPSATPLIIAAVGADAAWSAAMIAFVQIAASVVIAGVSAMLADDPFDSQGGYTVNQKSASPDRALMFGRIRSGGQITYVATTVGVGEILHILISISEGASHRFICAQMDDAFLYDDMTDDQGFANEGRYSHKQSSGGIVTFVNLQADLGTVGTSFPPVLANDGTWSTESYYQLSRIKSEWDRDTMRQDGVTKLYWRGKFTTGGGLWPTGAPNVSSWWDGIEVYDPRYSQNVYTQNVALIVRHYLLMTEAEGGFGANADSLPDADWITQANLCEEMILSPTGLTWTTGFNVASPSNIQTLAKVSNEYNAEFEVSVADLQSGYDSFAIDYVFKFENMQGMTELNDEYLVVTSRRVAWYGSGSNRDYVVIFKCKYLAGGKIRTVDFGTFISDPADEANGYNRMTKYDIPANTDLAQVYLDGGNQDDAMLELLWGSQVKFTATTGVFPSPIVLNDIYYVDPVRISKGWRGSPDSRWSIKIATSMENLTKGTYVAITDFGSGTHTIEKYAEPRYLMSAYIPLNQRPKAILEKMMDACFGVLRESGGEYTMRAGAWYSSDLTITESMLTGYPDITTGVSARENFNTVSGEFLSTQMYGQKTTYPEYKNSTYITTRDNGLVITRKKDLAYVSSSSQCQRIAKMLVETEAQEIRIKIPMKIIGLKLQVGSTFTFDQSFLGWTGKAFRCTKIEVETSMAGETGLFPSINIYAQETASAVYDWNSGEEIAIDPAPNTDYPLPETVEAPINLTVANTIYTADPTAIDKPIATFTWEVSDETAYNYSFDVRYKIVDADTDPDAGWFYMSQTTDRSIPIYNLSFPEDYVFEVRARDILQNVSEWATVNHLVIAPLGFPADVTGLSATVQGDVVLLKWDESTENWVRNGGHFEIRHTSELGTSDYYSTTAMEGGTVSGVSNQIILPVIEGTYMVKAVNIYQTASANPATVEVLEADMLDQFTLTHTLDESTGGFTGTKVDCSVVTSNLELDVTSGDVEALGTYAGATHYDAGAVTNFRIVKRIESLTFPESGDLWDSRTDPIDEWPDIDGVAGGGETNITYYIRHAQEVYASAVWSDWIPFDVLNVSARSFEVKVHLESDSVDTNLQISLMKSQFYEKV